MDKAYDSNGWFTPNTGFSRRVSDYVNLSQVTCSEDISKMNNVNVITGCMITNSHMLISLYVSPVMSDIKYIAPTHKSNNSAMI